MFLTFLGIIFGIAAFIFFGIDIRNGKWKKNRKCLLGVLIFAIFTTIGCIKFVPTGNTGIVTTFGKVENYTLEAGPHFLAPWNRVISMDNRNQKATVEMSCFSSDIQEVNVVYTVNYQIDKGNAQLIYKTIGSNYYDTVMTPKIQEAVKGVFAQYTAEALVESRGTLGRQITNVLISSLDAYNIEVVDTSLENIDFTDAFTNAVEAKQVAEQNKLKAKTEQDQATLEAEAAAERQVIQAQADSDAAIIAANADAEVQKIGADAAEYAGKKDAAILSATGEQLNRYPDLKYYLYYQSWNGKLPDTMLGNESNTLIDIP